MRLSSGFIRNLLLGQWSLEATAEQIIFSTNQLKNQSIDYLELKAIEGSEGTLSHRLNVKTVRGQTEFSGISKSDVSAFIAEVREYAGKAIARQIERDDATLQQADAMLTELKEGDFYLNQSKIAELKELLPSAVLLFEHPFFDPGQLSGKLWLFASKYKSFIDPLSPEVLTRNASYIDRKKLQYSPLFDQLEKYPLTDEQRTAVVTEEDNILLIAAAGSGKSSTLVAKILYLLTEGQFNASELIAFAYNKDAKDELSDRIGDLYKRFNLNGDKVPARTFHGFCMDVLAKANDSKPTIAEVATASKSRQLQYFNNLVDQLLASDSSFKSDLLNYFTIFKRPSPPESTIKTKHDYEEYLRSIYGRDQRDERTGEWRIVLRGMDGTEVKSLQELRLINWLFLQGIRYEYERPFEVDTSTQDRRQYFPDFYYPDVGLWHEHFAINSAGRAPAHFDNYEEGVRWKRAVHQQQRTRFFETTSAQFDDGSVFEFLDLILSECGVPRNPPPDEVIEELIAKTFNPARDLELVMTFLRHFKTNNLTLEALRSNIETFSDRTRAEAFYRVFEKIYLAYQKGLSDAESIDFEDLIHSACTIIESGAYQSPYRYLLVDEFQDASQDRLRLIKALANQNKHIKLFGVGDDWQSIYRFSGADLKVMTRFPEIFGFTEQLKLTETFRSYQQIVDVAAEFVQKNPEQIRKTVTAQSVAEMSPVILMPYPNQNPDEVLLKALSVINRKAIENNTILTVFILTRYTNQEPHNLSLIQSKFESLAIEWKTIHASKGLEADYVLLHHVNAGMYGFPSEFTDDPLLDLVVPVNEHFPHAEERRLMYVALTRAKKAIFVFYDEHAPSPFIRELAELDGVKSSDQRYSDPVLIGDSCPKCSSGKLQASKGSNGPFLGCSAYPECKFTTTLLCPECKVGQIVQRTAKKSGRVFFGCNRYPQCKHIQKI